MTSKAFLAALALTAAACGGPARSAPPSPAATPARTSTARSHAARSTHITIKDFAFTPRTVHVALGTRITWINRDKANHTVTFTRGPGDRGNLDPGRHLSVRFTRPGRYAYVCQYHPNMHGTVVVG